MKLSPDQAYDFILVALCVWREARGECLAAKRGVAWTIRNRVMRPSWWGTSWSSVVLKPRQFSSFNPGDPNALKWPSVQDTSWQACLLAAEIAFVGDEEDPTKGATHYHDASMDSNPPAWTRGSVLRPTVQIGNLRFYGPAGS